MLKIKKALCYIIVAAMAVCCGAFAFLYMPDTMVANAASTDQTVTDGTKLQDALFGATNGTVTLNSDITVTKTISLTSTINTTLDLNGKVITFTGTGTIFSCVNGGNLTIKDSRPNIEHKYSTSTVKNGITYDGLYSIGSGDGTLYGGIITGGFATDANDGGAITVSGSSSKRAVLTIQGGNIVGNYSQNNGGGIYVDTNTTVSISGTAQIIGNLAMTDGGGVYSTSNTTSQSTISINGGKIINNTSRNNNGGGLSVSGGTLTISGDTEISNNSAKVGGGLSVSSGTRITLAGGTISNNNARSGGGMAILSNVTLSINGGKIINNTATGSDDTTSGSASNKSNPGYGGAIYSDNSTITVSICEITGNSADYGGGIYANTTSTLNLTGGTIKENTASVNGGGVYLASNTSGQAANFNVNGTVIIRDNMHGTHQNNVYLSSNTKIGVDGVLTNADIGITTASDLSRGTAIVIIKNSSAGTAQSIAEKFLSLDEAELQSSSDVKQTEIKFDVDSSGNLVVTGGITLVSVPEFAHVTYSGAVLKPIEVTASSSEELGYEIKGTTGYTSAGEYTLTLHLTSTNSAWDNAEQSTGDITVSFVIEKLKIPKPTEDETEFIYDGKQKTYTINEDSAYAGYYTVSGNSAKDIGIYKVVVSLNQTKNTEWADGSTDNLEFQFEIKNAADTINNAIWAVDIILTVILAAGIAVAVILIGKFKKVKGLAAFFPPIMFLSVMQDFQTILTISLGAAVGVVALFDILMIVLIKVTQKKYAAAGASGGVARPTRFAKRQPDIIKQHGKYDFSFRAKIIQADENIKSYYIAIKNEVLSYFPTANKIEWSRDIVASNNQTILEFDVEDKKLAVYLALNADEYVGTRYNLIKIEGRSMSKMYVSSASDMSDAKQLISTLADRCKLIRGDQKSVNYNIEFATTKELLAKGLIRKK